MDSVFRDNNGRYLIIPTKIQDEPFVPVNYYAPNEEGAQLPVLSRINKIIQNLETEEDTTTIWGGDFNLLFDVQLDADGGSPNSSKTPHANYSELCQKTTNAKYIGYFFLTNTALPRDAKPRSSKEGLTIFFNFLKPARSCECS